MTVEVRKELGVFLGLTLVLSSVLYGYLLLSEPPRWGEWQSAGFMWCPGLAAVVTKLILRRPLSELGIRWGASTRFLPAVVYVPYLWAAIVYVTVWLTGLGAFDAGPLRELLARVGLGGLDPRIVLVPLLAAAAPVGALLGSLSALGEELGWRGLLAPALAQKTKIARASVITGLIWSVWHYPVVFVGFVVVTWATVAAFFAWGRAERGGLSAQPRTSIESPNSWDR